MPRDVAQRPDGNIDRTDSAAGAEHRGCPQVPAAVQRDPAGVRANGTHLQGRLDLIQRVGLADARLEIGIGLVGKDAARPQALGAIGGDQSKTRAHLEHNIIRCEYLPNQTQLILLVSTSGYGSLDPWRHVAAYPDLNPGHRDNGAV